MPLSLLALALQMYQRTTDLLSERSKEVEALAEELLRVETVNHDDLVRLIGPRPFEGDDAYKQYVAMTAEQAGDDEANAGDGESEGVEADDGGDIDIGGAKPVLAARPPSPSTE